ncbi:MAG: pseudouridine synthase [Pseudomonadota bacterium]|nr:pseudouridine synthase [Pseudomonadota bacterium]
MTDTQNKVGERLAKRIARAGLASRRGAEQIILEGRVIVNGRVIDSPALNVTGTDKIEVDGKPLPAAEPPRLYRYHKPSGLVTTHKDEKGRPTVFDRMPKQIGRVISIGRLDLTSEGLLLLTNDGELARHLERPDTGLVRRYRVRAYGKPDDDKLASLKYGVTIDGVRYGPVSVETERVEAANRWLMVSMTEGKNREVRKVLEWAGLTVNRLIRISYGPFQLGKLPRGAIEEIPHKVLKEQLGKFLSKIERQDEVSN